jgi:hypothetical protein
MPVVALPQKGSNIVLLKLNTERIGRAGYNVDVRNYQEAKKILASVNEDHKGERFREGRNLGA